MKRKCRYWSKQALKWQSELLITRGQKNKTKKTAILYLLCTVSQYLLYKSCRRD